MARSRMVRPDFFDDEKLGRMSNDARLTFIGMWVQSDDFGVVRGHAQWLKNKIHPHKTLSLPVFRRWLKELEDEDRIWAFEVNEELYYYIPGFLKHQTIDRPNPKLRNPVPPQEVIEASTNNRRSIDDSSTTHRRIREGKRREVKGSEDKRSKEKKDSPMPPELAALELYAVNSKLVEKWVDLLKMWKDTYPFLDIVAEVRKAHSWEIENPRRRKQDKVRFLGSWMRRADEYRARRKDQGGRSAEERARALKERTRGGS